MSIKKIIIKDTFIDLNQVICINKIQKRRKCFIQIFLKYNIRIDIIYLIKDKNDMINLAELLQDALTNNDFSSDLLEYRIEVYSETIKDIYIYGLYYPVRWN